MSYGISTSCLYPMNTENALGELGRAGVKTAEVFLNSISETTLDFSKKLNEIKDNYGMQITAVHPFSSFSETYMLFGEYERRYRDVLDFYKRCFECTCEVGADISIIHGSRFNGKLPHELYFERFNTLIEAGKEFGVRVAQENVNAHFSESPQFLQKMKKALGDDFNLVFDVKQAVRAGFSPLDFAEEFKNNIIRIHVSDNTAERDCLPPGKGSFDFKSLISVMESVNYKGDYIIELYRENFKDEKDLISSLRYLQSL